MYKIEYTIPGWCQANMNINILTYIRHKTSYFLKFYRAS